MNNALTCANSDAANPGGGITISGGRGDYSESRAETVSRQQLFNVPQQTMRRKGQIMHESAHGMRSSYKAGCRCDLCKQAESAYKRGLRKRQREAVGEFVTRAVPSLSLVTGDGGEGLRLERDPSELGAVESAVLLEIEGLGAHHRPGLDAAALALARVLDNPKAVSTQPAAAKVLAQMLDKLRSLPGAHRGKLAVVRAMTEETIPQC
jgi:hypothetical protein